jgi:hypothetical protein
VVVGVCVCGWVGESASSGFTGWGEVEVQAVCAWAVGMRTSQSHSDDGHTHVTGSERIHLKGGTMLVSGQGLVG